MSQFDARCRCLSICPQEFACDWPECECPVVCSNERCIAAVTANQQEIPDAEVA